MIRLADIVESSAARRPRGIAVRFGERAVSYDELATRVRKLVAVLEGYGVGGGDKVALISCNCIAHIELVFACARLGAVCVQMNVRLSNSVTAKLLDEADPRVIVLSSAMMERFNCDSLFHVNCKSFVVVDGEMPGSPGYEQLINEARPSAFTAPYDKDAPVLMLYTSGTTGTPRGVLFSHRAIECRISKDSRDLGIDGDTVSLCVLPMYHITLMSSLLVMFQGATLIISDLRDAESIAGLIRKNDVTFVGLVPFILRALVKHLEWRSDRLASLKTVLYGGEPIDQTLLARSQKTLECGFIQGYGMTETASAICYLRPEQHLIPGKLATVGTPVEGVEIKLLDEAGEEVEPGEPGEIVVKTDTIMSGYFGDEKRTSEVLVDGWYRTGDIARTDGDGFIVLLDRKANLVISGGENVYPTEVCVCIKQLVDDVDDVVVRGVPDDYWGEALAAAVVRRPGSSITADEIATWCKYQLGSYKKPRKVVFVPEIKRSATGKPDKAWFESLFR